MHAMTNPGKAREWHNRAQAALASVEEAGPYADGVRAAVAWSGGVLHLYEDDPAAALDAFDRAVDLWRLHDRLTGSELHVHTEAAMCLLLLGQPKQALARAARTDGLPFGLGDNHAVTALAHLALSHVEVATQHILDHALEAATGKVGRKCSDSLLMLAHLAHAEGDDPTAIDLLAKAGMCRQPSTIQCARVLARTLGRAEQHARDELECMTPQSTAEHGPLGVRRAMAALHEEIRRRGWG
jgi:hypothetical protein